MKPSLILLRLYLRLYLILGWDDNDLNFEIKLDFRFGLTSQTKFFDQKALIKKQNNLYAPKELVLPYRCDKYCNKQNSVSVSYNN